MPPVTLLAAVWPRMLYYEHEMIGECLLLGAFIATVALAAPRGALADRRRLGWFLAMAVVIVAVKPAGRPLWLGLFLAALLITRNPLAWPRKFFLTVPAVILIALTSGGDGQGPWLFLSSTLLFIKTEGEPYARERALLRPAIQAARADLANYAFHQKHYKKMLIETGPDAKLGPEYVALAKDKARFSKVAKTLGVPAVLAHPVQYAQLVGQKILIAASNRFHDRRLLPAEFWLDEAESVQGRWARHPGEMKLLYAMDEPAFRAVAAERARRTFWFEPQVRWFARVRWLTAEPGAPGMPPTTNVTWLGWLTLLGLAGALAPGRCARTSILWLPLPIYVCAVFAIGDRVSRYFQPIEWAMFILIAIGLDVVLDALAALWQSVRPAPTAAPTAAPEPAEGG